MARWLSSYHVLLLNTKVTRLASFYRGCIPKGRECINACVQIIKSLRNSRAFHYSICVVTLHRFGLVSPFKQSELFVSVLIILSQSSLQSSQSRVILFKLHTFISLSFLVFLVICLGCSALNLEREKLSPTQEQHEATEQTHANLSERKVCTC